MQHFWGKTCNHDYVLYGLHLIWNLLERYDSDHYLPKVLANTTTTGAPGGKMSMDIIYLFNFNSRPWNAIFFSFVRYSNIKTWYNIYFRKGKGKFHPWGVQKRSWKRLQKNCILSTWRNRIWSVRRVHSASKIREKRWRWKRSRCLSWIEVCIGSD